MVYSVISHTSSYLKGIISKLRKTPSSCTWHSPVLCKHILTVRKIYGEYCYPPTPPKDRDFADEIPSALSGSNVRDQRDSQWNKMSQEIANIAVKTLKIINHTPQELWADWNKVAILFLIFFKKDLSRIKMLLIKKIISYYK